MKKKRKEKLKFFACTKHNLIFVLICIVRPFVRWIGCSSSFPNVCSFPYVCVCVWILQRTHSHIQSPSLLFCVVRTDCVSFTLICHLHSILLNLLRIICSLSIVRYRLTYGVTWWCQCIIVCIMPLFLVHSSLCVCSSQGKKIYVFNMVSTKSLVKRDEKEVE